MGTLTWVGCLHGVPTNTNCNWRTHWGTRGGISRVRSVGHWRKVTEEMYWMVGWGGYVGLVVWSWRWLPLAVGIRIY